MAISNLGHRRLTIELRRLREQAGLSRDDVAEALEDWTVSRLTKAETGRWSKFRHADLRQLLSLYGVTEQRDQEPYVNLVRKSKTKGWWTQPGYAEVAVDYTAFEDAASMIETFEPCNVPGLLQTEDYARALARANPANDTEEAERRVALRLERQKLLDTDGPELWAIIDEALLHRPVGGPEVMAAQLHHLIEVANSRLVNLQVLPFAAGAHPGMDGSFVILTFTDPPLGPPVVYLETATDGLYPEDERIIERYRTKFTHLRASALSTHDSARTMEQAIARLGA